MCDSDGFWLTRVGNLLFLSWISSRWAYVEFLISFRRTDYFKGNLMQLLTKMRKTKALKLLRSLWSLTFASSLLANWSHSLVASIKGLSWKASVKIMDFQPSPLDIFKDFSIQKWQLSKFLGLLRLTIIFEW